MKISYAIPVKDELHQIQHLITHLLDNKRSEDEIVVLYDSKNGHEYVEEYLRSHSVNSEYMWYERPFEGSFADQKNYLNSMCNGDWIFQIDADEVPDEHLLEVLPGILVENEATDLLWVPRVNIVKGITPHHIRKWGWIQDDQGRVNFPDFQSRIYRNKDSIQWTNHVHERIIGAASYAFLPTETEYSLFHAKDINRQERQNEFYNTL